MSGSEDPTRVRHNFSAVDNLVSHLGGRHRAQSANWNAQTWTHYAAWGSVVIASIGAAVFLILWGVSLVIQKPEPKIIETERIIERPVTINPTIRMESYREPGSLEMIRDEAATRIGDLVTSDPTSATTPGSEATGGAAPVYNYVIFKELVFRKGGALGLTVGMKYQDSDSTQPAEQWCYVEFPTDDIGVLSTIQLASVSDGFRTNNPISVQMAREAGTSVSVLRDAQAACAFE